MKQTFWKYFGAMMSEKKDGVTAVSFTRLLGVLCFGVWLALIILQAINFGAEVTESGLLGGVEVPSDLTWGMMAFVGIKGGKDIAVALKSGNINANGL